MGKVTINDVAKMAGASRATVSRVLSNPDYPVARETREKVLHAVQELGYMPNMVANSTQKASMMDIGVIVPNITNQFYALTILGIEKEFRKQGYNILLCNSFRDPQQERKLLQSLYNKKAQGVIISSVAKEGGNVIEFSKKGMQFILLDQKIEELECNHISFEYEEGAHKAMEYLHEMGHRQVCLATTPLTRWSRQEIYSGFRRAISEAGIAFEENMLLVADQENESDEEGIYENRSGQLLARKFLQGQNKATAVLCVNDMVAFGFIQELHAHGVRVPEDISVVGFDDIPFASMFSPALTTVHCPTVETGSLAAQLMIQKLEGKIPFGFGVKLEARLVQRSSVMQR
ncbi:LacI family DNA-binding transcriptional regulator [Oscillospiraceae bacterium MB08-C2-2]|nr:LacI family DNA-binding transcriptional regulator [Oscillospiraceae bacterium MB08-C2-2]